MTQNASFGCDLHHSFSAPEAVDFDQNYKEKATAMDTNLLQLTAALYRASLDEAEWPTALEIFRKAVNADACVLAVHDFDTGRGRILHAVGMDLDAVTAYARRHSRYNLWLQQESWFTAAPAVIESHRMVPAEDLLDSGFYRDWLRPLGLLEHVFVVLNRSDGVVTYFACARAEEKRRFPAESLNQLEAMSPHLQEWFVADRKACRLRRLREAAFESLDWSSTAIVFLDAEGAAISTNRAARAILDAGEPLFTANGGLAFDVGGRRVKLRELVAQVTGTPRDGEKADYLAFSLPRMGGHRALTLLLRATRSRETDADAGMPAAVLCLGDPERVSEIDHLRLAKLYGLSRAEARVAALLATGYRLDQIAEALGVAYETVRKHLKQIFGKTGTYRQAELVRMIVTGPAGLIL